MYIKYRKGNYVELENESSDTIIDNDSVDENELDEFLSQFE